jgi:hypothetical protein
VNLLGAPRARARAATAAVAVVRQVMGGGCVVGEEPVLAFDGAPARDEDGEILMRRGVAAPLGSRPVSGSAQGAVLVRPGPQLQLGPGQAQRAPWRC